MDIKDWFEHGTGLKIREIRYLKTPPLPYNLFIDDLLLRGADLRNNIIEHNLVIEHYSIETNATQEKAIEKFLTKEREGGRFSNFAKTREYLEEEKMYVTLFEVSPFFEKVRRWIT